MDIFAGRFVQFVIGIVLARLLSPAEFGLLAALNVFIMLGQAITDSGFSVALVQRKEIEPQDASSVFFVNLMISGFVAALFAYSGRWIALFFRQPQLEQLAYAMSAVFVISAFGAVQAALIRRHLDFKVQTKVSVIAGICSGGFGIASAYYGLGVWSLVIQQISNAFFRSILLWFFNDWRPQWVIRWTRLKALYAYGFWVMLSGLSDQFFSNLYDIIIGRFADPATLGFYNRARRLQEMPSSTITSVVGRVSLPLFSTIQDQTERLKRGLRKSISMLMFINCPAMFGLAAVARPLVTVLLTEKWLPCVPYLQVLCLIGVQLPLHALNLHVVLAKGRSDLFFRLEVIKKILVVVNIGLTYRWGVMAMIVGQLVTSSISYLLNSYYSGKFLSYSAIEQIKDIGIYAALAAAMAGGIVWLPWLGLENAGLLLAAQVSLGAAIYLGLAAMWDLDVWQEAKQIAGKVIGKTMSKISIFGDVSKVDAI